MTFKKDKSVRSKLYIMTVLSAVLLYAASLVTANLIHTASLETRYKNLCETVVETTCGLMSGKDISSFVNDRNSYEYIQLDKKIDTLKQTIPDIYSIGIYAMATDGMGVVFTTDSSDITADSVSKYDLNWGKYRESFLESKVIEDARIPTDDGMSIMYCKPFSDNENESVYVCASVLKEKIDNENKIFMSRNVVSLAFVMIFIICMVFLLIEVKIVKPMSKIGGLVKKAATTNDTEFISEIRESDIKTGNEIENIYRSLLKTYTLKSRLSNAMEKADEDSVDSVAWLIRRMDVFNTSHLDNSLQYIILLLNEMKNKEEYKEQITEQGIENVLLAAPFHDVGKLVISEEIVNKPGKLSEAEFEIMKDHCVFGAKIISNMFLKYSSESYLGLAREIALHHHEKWDGNGYPHRLKGEQIPLFVRVVSIATVFDTLLSKRAYNRAFTFKEAMDVIISEKGKLFDPGLVDIFVESKDKFYDAYMKMKESL